MNTMARRYEDFAVGEVVEGGPVEVTAGAIKAFAEQFDPQSPNDDTAPDAAVAGQVASGLHITCLNMRLLVDAFLCDTQAMGSPGVEEICYFTRFVLATVSPCGSKSSACADLPCVLTLASSDAGARCATPLERW
jgi:hypothetical protein